MRHYITLIFLFLTASLLAQEIPTSDLLKKHIGYLASDELKGRKAGSEGDSLAAVYIRQNFEKAGLKPVFKNGFQYFSLVTDVTAGKSNSLKVGNTAFVASKDFQPFSFSTSDSLTAKVVFTGFGISGQSDSLKWDDFKDVDVKGKWLLILRGDPEPDNATSAFIPMASDRAKALTAKDKGAAGILLVTPTSIDRADRPIDITFDKSVSDAGIPVISITRSLASKILSLPVTAIDSIEKSMISKKKSSAFLTNTVLSARTEIVREKAVSRNVAFMLNGSDPRLANEYIVIGAHYDHLGMGGEGSGSRVPDEIAVHHGADDNASGVASLIELASYFAKHPTESPRSLIFVAFGAEEMGIIGSRYFVEHSPIPVKSIKAMINMDMVGRLKTDDPTLSISGTGTSNVTDSI
ncbi:MAG TPA: M20/M25/M40 family metallo-hydrolase, partial [Lentimicrobium sp.]|nr:M20/M25/M40 family metallo-hydrolase [Lentimicrobium sp.]